MAITDLSGWTEVPPQAAQADIRNQDPVTYASAMTDAAVRKLHEQGLSPEVGTAQDIFKQHLEDATKLRTDIAEKGAAEELSKQHELWRLLPVAPGQPSPTELQKAEEAKIAMAEKQQEEGVTAAASSAQRGGGYVMKATPDDIAKSDMYANGYDRIDNLGKSFNKMITDNPIGAGGQLRSAFGRLEHFADATSLSALNFSRDRDITDIPMGRAVIGETGATPSKESIMAKSDMIMPRVTDGETSGNEAIYRMKEAAIKNFQNFRDNRYNSGFDTTAADVQLARMRKDFMSPEVQKWNPMNTQAVVANGTSPAANQTINDNLNAGANKGLPVTTVTDPTTGAAKIVPVPGAQTGGNRTWSAAGPSQPVQQPVAPNLGMTGTERTAGMPVPGAPAQPAFSASGPGGFQGPSGPNVGMTGTERLPPQSGLAQTLQFLQQHLPLKPGGPATENPWTLMGGQPDQAPYWGIGR